jgi:hypothetical protein
MAEIRRKLFRLAAGAALVTSAVLGLWAYHGSGKLQQALAVEPPPCDLNAGPCGAPLPAGAKVMLTITPSPIPVMVPLHIEMSASGFIPTRVSLDFAGEDMNMGLLRPELLGTEPGRFQGEMVLPVCVSGPMRWRATLMLESDRGAFQIPFRFEAPLARH